MDQTPKCSESSKRQNNDKEGATRNMYDMHGIGMIDMIHIIATTTIDVMNMMKNKS